MIWDLSTPVRKPGKAQLSDAELTSLWTDLASDDAVKAEEAIETLVQAPAQAVPFLRGRLKRVVPIPAADLDRLVSQLGSEELGVRNKAIAQLKEVLDQAEPVLQRALLKGKAGLETQRRIDLLLKELPPAPDAGTLQMMRAMEVLEKIASETAREVLMHLSDGAPFARTTQEAAAALARVERSTR
jgi:hypothetical protein